MFPGALRSCQDHSVDRISHSSLPYPTPSLSEKWNFYRIKNSELGVNIQHNIVKKIKEEERIFKNYKQ